MGILMLTTHLYMWQYVLHCWDDDDCVKILRQCKRAISSGDGVGKVIIMNVVVGYGTQDSSVLKETHVLFDIFMMRYGGAEREEHEWKKIFQSWIQRLQDHADIRFSIAH